MERSNFRFNPISEVIDDIRQGKMVIIVDDESRENEGDLVMAAELVTAEAITFMARFGKGLICAPLTTNLAQKFNLEPMVKANSSTYETAFTISIDAKDGISTGISSADRARTLKLLTEEQTTEADFSRPGHIFPLIAKDGGVKIRRGHTEAAVDLAKLAGLKPVGIICEILNDDGTMARGKELFEFAKNHDLKIGTIDDLVNYLNSGVEIVSSINFPNKYGDFKMTMFKNISGEEHIAFTKGELNSDEEILVRVHSECFTGDIFGSKRCECGEQLAFAMEEIEKAGKGIVIYLRQEGRGIGLSNKLRAYALQDTGLDTVDANIHLGLPVDSRSYLFAGKILNYFGIKNIRLMTNNPQKIQELAALDFKITRFPIEIKPHHFNRQYLVTKSEKMGHQFSSEVLYGDNH